MRILIVDDSSTMRRIIARTLRSIELPELVIEEAGSGAEGLRACRDRLPDLVLSDVHMPELDGYTMVRKLRESEIDVPVGFITSEGESPSFCERATAVGADFVLRKPFTEEALLDALAGKHRPSLQPIERQLRYRTLRGIVQRTSEQILGAKLTIAQRLLPRVPETMSGALISIVHAGERTHVGLFASVDTLGGLARMMQSEPSAEPSSAEIRDGLCELVNVIGGNLRSCFPDERTRLGLPEFVEEAATDPRTAGIAYEVEIDHHPLVLLLQTAAPS